MSGYARSRNGQEGRGRARRVLIVGARETGQQIAASLRRSPEAVEVIGFVDDEAPARQTDLPILGGTADIDRLVHDHAIDEIVVAYVPSWLQNLMSGVSRNGCVHPEVKVVPRLYETMLGRIRFSQLDETPLVSLNGSLEDKPWSLWRRLSDVVLASGMLMVFSPFMLLAALLVRLTSRGPVILRQKRVGRAGRVFTLYKFRSMVEDAEAKTGPVLASEQDGRCTAVGRLLRATKIDEMPQLFNVLKGEMSVVGPRPERPMFVKEFERKVPGYRMRHAVKPGLTGLAQIHAGYSVNVHDKLKYDLMYVANQSVWLDWKIVLETPMRMVQGAWHARQAAKEVAKVESPMVKRASSSPARPLTTERSKAATRS